MHNTFMIIVLDHDSKRFVVQLSEFDLLCNAVRCTVSFQKVSCPIVDSATLGPAGGSDNAVRVGKHR